MILSAVPAIFWFWFFWQLFPAQDLFFFLWFPFGFFATIGILILSSILIAKFFLLIVNLFHKPKEGSFLRNKTDKDYRYWSLRAVIKKWPFWLARQLSLPFFETLGLKILGVKTSLSNSLHESYIDTEFVQIGKNVKIGQGSIIMSNLLVQDRLIVKKVKIADNVIIGAHSYILPGTLIEENSIVESNSITKMNQYIEKSSIYSGRPAKKIPENEMVKSPDPLRKLLLSTHQEKNIDEEAFLREHVKELSIPFHFYLIAGWIIIGVSFMLPGFLFYMFFFEFLVPSFLSIQITLNLLLHPSTYLIIILIPIVFIGLYLLHLFFVALFTRWFYKLADRRGPSQGIFDRNLNAASKVLDYYHFRSFLMKYPIFAISRSPFPWLLNWELQFIKSNQVGKGTIFEETFIHSHVNFGKDCYLGTYAHLTNHLVDGVYGEENLTFVGVDVGDNTVLNAMTGALPGTEFGKNSTTLPGGTTIKYDKIGDNGIFEGFPIKKLKKNEFLDFLGGEYSGE